MACLGLHLCAIVAVCLRDTFSLLATTPTIFPSKLSGFWQRGEEIVATASGQRLPVSHPIREGIVCYLDVAGIEGGYGFFAPNVPNNYKLVFELHYIDGRTEYEIPKVSSPATGLRLSGLLDGIAETEYEPLREMMVKILTYSVWQDHPEATSVRAVFGVVTLPTPADFAQGGRESYQPLYVYDFTFGKAQPHDDMR